MGEISRGIIPSFPADTDVNFVIPWVGFILAGASGILWFSYWVSARGYAGTLTKIDEVKRMEQNKYEEDFNEHKEKYSQLKSWFNTMSTTAVIGVVGGGIILISFLILGTELLRPEGIIPQGIDVAKDLTNLLSDIWGNMGQWFLIIGIMIALLGTILSCQDGYGRMFADGTALIAMPYLKKKKLVNPELPDLAEEEAEPRNDIKGKEKKITSVLLNKKWLRTFYIILLGGVFPIITFLIVRNPVDILAVAGTVAAVHTPVVVFLTLHINRSRLPYAVRPGKFIFYAMWLSGLSYGAFAVFHFFTL